MIDVEHKALEVRDLSVAFRTGAALIYANRDVSFEHEQGEWLSVMGPSGSGKTVLGRAIAGLTIGAPGIVKGTISFRGHNLLDTLPDFVLAYRNNGTGGFRKDVQRWQKRHWRNITMHARNQFAYIFQNPYDALNPYVPISRHLKEAFLAGGIPLDEIAEKSKELFVQLRLTPPERIVRCYPHELSGGMAQRVAVAMAMAQRASYIIADECTSSLDPASAHGTLDLLHQLQDERGCSVLFISHDAELAQSFSHRMLKMDRGELKVEER